MQAIIQTAFGSPDVLKVQEVATPRPKANEVLIRIRAINVNFGDMLVRRFNTVSPSEFSMPTPLWIPTRLTLGIRKPRVKIPGSEFAGTIEAVGEMVTRFKVGDEVFGYRSITMGAGAEYLAMPEDGVLTHKPRNLSFEEAATIPYGSLTAIQLLKKANIQPGQKVLILGASGGIGSYALQLAKHYGAEVTGVCGTSRVEMVKALGADHVIDYTKEDFTQNGETYDLILDVIRKTSFGDCKDSLTSNGIYLLASFKMKQLFQMLWTSLFSKKKVICALASETTENLDIIKDLAESGVINTVLDRSFLMKQVAEAHHYIESGQRTGHVVIQVAT